MAYVAIFTDRGRLVGYSGDQDLAKRVAAELRNLLPPARDCVEREIDEARRRVLDRIAKGSSVDQEEAAG